MKTIEIDDDIYNKLADIAKPFVETTPNLVLRRILGMTVKNQITSNRERSYEEFISMNSMIEGTLENIDRIGELRSVSHGTHPAFLTFLMDKYYRTNGNYMTSNIIDFMEKVNLCSVSGELRNPWMPRSYGGKKNGLVSCQRTIEHFRQTRKFGCWNGKDAKMNCDAKNYCTYHPGHSDKIGNKCDLRNGVIWKRTKPGESYAYGANYIDVIKKQILKDQAMPLKPLLAVFYPNVDYNTELLIRFKTDFNIKEQEMILFSE